MDAVDLAPIAKERTVVVPYHLEPLLRKLTQYFSEFLAEYYISFPNLRVVVTFLKIVAGVFTIPKTTFLPVRKQQVLHFPYYEGSMSNFIKGNLRGK